MKRLRSAIGFLTVIPVPPSLTADNAGAVIAAVPFFPLVGALIGLTAAVLDRGLSAALPAWPAAAISIGVLAAASGALHLDGLADTADGFLSARPREQILRIMKDSHIGTMGVLALIFVIVLKIACLAAMPANTRLAALFLAPLTGRGAILAMLAWLPYARPEGGLARDFFGSVSRRRLLLTGAGLAIAAIFVARLHGLTAVLAAVLAVTLLCRICQRRIGGGTGDTLGAACELAETMVLLVMAA